MNFSRYAKRLIAPLAASALLLAGCSSSGDSASGGSGSDIIVAYGSEPQNPLIPTNTNETGGGRIVNQLFAGLTYTDAKGDAHNDVAESIETNDSQTYTVTLKDNQYFSDGSPVTSHSFVDAWNQGVRLGHLSGYFFETIKGYPGDDEDALKNFKELEGLKVIDDKTFTIELNQPESDFPLRLSYNAFYPLPESGIGDEDTVTAFGENPIGNGPYKFASADAWHHNETLDLVVNDKYDGPRKAQNGGIQFKFYAQTDAAYNDLLSGVLDVLDAVPDSAYGTFESELGDRAVNQPAAIFQSFTIPERLEHWSGEEGNLRRQAISYAINRDEITQTIFQGTRTPAKDFTSPVVNGYDPNVEGNEVLNYDPEKAKELWAQANAISDWGNTKLQLSYNADGGHQSWVDATMNSIKNTLGIDAVGNPYPDFKSLRSEITDRTIKTAFRTGWQADYPALSNFLGAVYGTGAGSNDGDYSNPEFDALLKKGAGASSLEEANKYYEQAQTILFQDLPAIPLWYSNITGGYSENVSNVVFGWNSEALYYQITKA